MLAEYMHRDIFIDGTYAMQEAEALNLHSDKEETAVKEEEVSLPFARIIVSLGVKGTGYRPDRSSSHFLIIVIYFINYNT